MKRLLVHCTLLLVFVSGPVICDSAESSRCGSKVIQVGDSIHKVKKYCGDPSSKEVVGEYKQREKSKREVTVSSSEQMTYVTEWAYYSYDKITTYVFHGNTLVNISTEYDR